MPRETATATSEEWAERTVNARRLARLRYATDRVTKLADGEPKFTDEELAALAGVFLARIGGEMVPAGAAGG
jgi:hypothetical protein